MANLSNINNKFIVTSETEALIGATSWAGVGSGTLAAGLVISGNTSQFILDNPSYNHFTMYSASDSNIYNVFGSSGNYLIGTGNKDTSSWSEKMRIDNSGNVGIGVTPSAWQTISNSNALQFYGSYIYNYRDTNLLIGNNAYYDGAWKYYKASIGATKFNSGSGAFDFAVSSGGNADAAITWIDALKINSSGQILIGTDTPRGLVTIDQLGVNTVGLVINSTSATYPPYLYLRDQGGTGYSEIQANNDLYLNCTNVGIGTNSPEMKLDVKSNSDTAPSAYLRGGKSSQGEIQNTGLIVGTQTNMVAGDYQGISFTGYTSTSAIRRGRAAIGVKAINGPGKMDLVFMTRYADDGTQLTSADEKMRITGDGYLKASNDGTYFSTAGPYHELRQSSPANWTTIVNNTSATPYGLYMLFSGASPNNTQEIIYFADSTAQRFYVTSAGAVYGNGTYGTISDRKLKENIEDATTKLDDINKLKVRNFNFKDKPEEKHIGFIAQEFEEVFPKAVENTPDKDSDGKIIEDSYTKTIKTSILIPMLVKSIQELKADNDILKSRIETLENK